MLEVTCPSKEATVIISKSYERFTQYKGISPNLESSDPEWCFGLPTVRMTSFNNGYPPVVVIQ